MGDPKTIFSTQVEFGVSSQSTSFPASFSTNPLVSQKTPSEIKPFFNWKRKNILVFVICLLAFILYFIYSAHGRKNVFIREISGLSAIDEAVGRATEMGKGVIFVPGIFDMTNIQTLAGITILGHVAQKTAEYDTPLFAPMARSFAMTVAQGVVKQAYLEKGRLDAFRPDRINYLTDCQMGFVAGVCGIMMREKPAACFFLGDFMAESLLLAETGNHIGAVQIAGTTEPTQIPFFVTTCDYTLIGEELFAASAYLSKNPKEVGSLKGQDMAKACLVIIIIIGAILMTVSRTSWAGRHPKIKIAATTFLDFFETE